MSSLKERSLSEGTAELSDPDTEQIIVRIKANMKFIDVNERYENAVRRAITAISGREEIYVLEPILIASDVQFNILEELPTSVAGFHIRASVVRGQLFVTDLSTGPPHAGGVGAFNFQARLWNARNRFDIFSDATSKFGEEASGAPDMVFTIPEKYTRPGRGRQTVGKC